MTVYIECCGTCLFWAPEEDFNSEKMGLIELYSVYGHCHNPAFGGEPSKTQRIEFCHKYVSQTPKEERNQNVDMDFRSGT